MSRTVVVSRRGGAGIGPASEAFARDGDGRRRLVPAGRRKEADGGAEHGL